MKVLITGGRGQLGFDVIKELKLKYGEDVSVMAPDRDFMDLEDSVKVDYLITNYKPDIVIHCAAYTAVDEAEKDIESVYLTNIVGTKNVTLACAKVNAKLVFISSDYVFDGEKNKPYNINDKTNPINNYGMTKVFGEKIVSKYSKSFIVRTSLVFGINGNNFIKSMIERAKVQNEIKVVDDQISNPTYTVDLAKKIIELVQTDKYGVYHITNEGAPSKYDVIKYALECYHINTPVKRAKTSDFNTLATRPLYSVLDTSSLTDNGFEKLSDWHDAVLRYVSELKLEESKKLVVNK